MRRTTAGLAGVVALPGTTVVGLHKPFQLQSVPLPSSKSCNPYAAVAPPVAANLPPALSLQGGPSLWRPRRFAAEKCDRRSALEAEAYSCWLGASLLQEAEGRWQAAVAKFGRCKRILQELAKVGLGRTGRMNSLRFVAKTTGCQIALWDLSACPASCALGSPPDNSFSLFRYSQFSIAAYYCKIDADSVDMGVPANFFVMPSSGLQLH